MSQTSHNNKQIAKNTMIYDKIINKLKGILRKFACNIKNVLLNGVASSVFTPPFCKDKYLNYLATISIKQRGYIPNVFVAQVKENCMLELVHTSIIVVLWIWAMT